MAKPPARSKKNQQRPPVKRSESLPAAVPPIPPKPAEPDTTPTAPNEEGLVIHHPEREKTALLRWFEEAVKQPWFYLLAAAIVVIPFIIVIRASLNPSGSEAQRRWLNLEEAPRRVAKELQERNTGSLQTEQGQIELTGRMAEEYQTLATTTDANDPVAGWAALRAGGEFFNAAILSLPKDQEGARDQLERASTQYEAAIDRAAAGSALSRLARLGHARTLEARNDIDEAISAYKKLADDAPASIEGIRAAELADRLDRPESRKFYQDLYAYKPPVPPSLLDTPPIPPGPAGGEFGPPIVVPPAPGEEMLPPPPPPPDTAPELPADPFAPTTPDLLAPAPAPAPDPAPTPPPAPATTSELPTDPFTPPTQP